MRIFYSLLVVTSLIFGASAAAAQPVASVSIAETSGADTICAGSAVTFTASAVNGGSGPTYQWYVNGSPVPGVTGATYATTTLPAGSPYVYCLMASNLGGVTGSPATSDTISLSVIPRPIAMIGDSDTICTGATAHIGLTLSNGSQWRVIFTNGIRPDTTVAFASPWTYYFNPTSTGSYHLVSVSNGECTAQPSGMSGVALVVVYPNPIPVITPLDSIQCLNGNSFNFSSSHSTITGGSIVQWSWIFAGLSPDTSSSPSPVVNFTDTGTNRRVTLIETTDKGCSAFTAIKISIKASPDASFSLSDTSICSGASISAGASADSGAVYTWYWGDGSDTICSCDTAYHSYTTYNDKRARLSITNTAGCKDTSGATIHIHALPQAAFTINDASQCFKGNEFIFTDHSTLPVSQQYGDIISIYSWDFGDQSPPDGSVDPIHFYTDNIKRNYPVTESITSSGGCRDSVQLYLTVFQTPTITINTSGGKDTLCIGSTYTLTAANNAAAPSYKWSNNDTTKSITGVSDTTSANGNLMIYTVAIRDAANNNCADTATKTITAAPNPSAPVINNGSIPVACDSSTVHFDVTNIADNTRYFWYTSPSLPISGQDDPHSNITFGTADSTAQVSVTATNVWGCSSSQHEAIPIRDAPVPSVSISALADALDTTLIAMSLPDSGISYQWGYDGTGFAPNAISGATAQALLLDSGQNSAAYWVIVTDTIDQCATKVYYTMPVTATGIKGTDGTDAIVTVYPNPSKGDFNLTIHSASPQMWTLDALDMSGETIERKRTPEGMNAQETISAAGWAAGEYMIRITSQSGQTKVLKLIKE